MKTYTFTLTKKLMSSDFRSRINVYTKGEMVAVQGAQVVRESLGERRKEIRGESGRVNLVVGEMRLILKISTRGSMITVIIADMQILMHN